MKSTAAEDDGRYPITAVGDAAAFTTAMQQAEHALRAQRPIDPPEDHSGN